MKKKQYTKEILELFEEWKTRDEEVDALLELRDEYEKWRKK